MNPAVVFDQLSFFYPAYGEEPHLLLQKISCIFEAGKLHVVIGEPGSGKSTLAHILTGLVPHYSGGEMSGDVSVLGESVRDLLGFEFVPRAGLVMQDAHQQIITSSCSHEIAFPLEALGLPREEIQSRIDNTLDFFDMNDFRHRDPAELSGGELKKLLLAVAYAVDPPLLVLDESLEEIDTAFRRKYLWEMKRKQKSIIYFAAKPDPVIEETADSWYLMEEGKINRIQQAPTISYPGRRQDKTSSLERDSLVTINNCRFGYENRFTLSIDTLTLYSGEVTALVGPNGCGKTTLCRILSGLAVPEEGSITIGMHEVHARYLSAWAGYLFQNPDYQIFLPTVTGELTYGMRRMGLDRAECEKKSEELQKMFLLPSGNTPPSMLSYGERKLLQSAVYYALPKGLYIFDEVDSGLSLPLLSRILDLYGHRNAALLLVTHHQGFAEAVADRIITMGNGKIVRDERLGGRT